MKDEQELGAIYRDTYEKYLTLEIAQAMREELSGYGNVEVFMTRDTDKALTLKERAAYAEAVGGDLLVSLHLNASAEHNFYGSEVFVSAFEHFHARGAGVGESILKQLTDYGFVSKGVKTRLGSKGADYYGIIRECKSLGIPALIVEHGYMDEDSDWAVAARWVEWFWNQPLRKGPRRYYDNCLYLFALLALSGRYRIWS